MSSTLTSKFNRKRDTSLMSGTRKATTGPVPGRNRSWGLITLAALLVIGFGLGVAAWGIAAGDKASVLALAKPVPKGHTIDRSELVSVSVSGIDDAINVAQVDSVVGKTAATDLIKGQVLTRGLVSARPVPARGQAVVGLALEPSLVPTSGLKAGDVVDLIAVPAANAAATKGASKPTVLDAQARVFNVTGDSAAGSKILVTVVVNDSSAANVAAYSAQGRVAVIEAAPAGEQ